MTRRWIGQAVVAIEYTDRESEGRWIYRGHVTVPKGEAVVGEGGAVNYRPVRWPFELQSAPGGVEVAGRRVAADSPEAFDEMARVAIMFGSAYSPEHPDPKLEVAAVIEEATTEALGEDGDYTVRRHA